MMDTSKEYIEMCRKAVEVQDAWDFKDGDFLYDKKYGVEVWSGYDAWGWPGPPRIPPNPAWIPRQDQLQDMLFQLLGKTFVYWLDRFYKYAENQESHESMIGGCYSMEQLWLAFVMHEKYGKTWDGKDWNPM